MAIGGSPPGAPRAKDGSKGAAGRFTFLVEAARGYLGALWLARDTADASEDGVGYVRHVAPLVAASARAAILDGARWAIAGAESDRFQIVEGRSSVDLVTPFVDGEILRSLLRTAAVKHASAEPAVLLGMALALVEQLESVHERALATASPHGFGGVHPDSVVVDVRGGVHLLDVGAAAAASSREPFRSDPQRIGYSAPEQLETRAAADARTDVFAVGIFLWEALANRRLFPGNDAKSARERVQKANIARLDATRGSASPAIAKDIADVVARCLERAPAARFQSMSELGAAIRALDPAPPERVGAWVTALADAAIGKRRQILERAAAGTLTGEERLTLPPQSVRPANGEGPAATSRPPAKRASLPPAPAPRPSSVPAPRLASVPAAGSSGNGAALAARSGGTLPGPTPEPPSARAVSLAGAPPPPSARSPSSSPAHAPPPPSARSPAHASPPPSAPAHPPPPPSARVASATTTPVASSHPPPPPSARVASATTTPIAGPAPPPASATATPVVTASPQPPPVAKVETEPQAEPSSPSTEAEAPRARADSAEAIEPEEADEPAPDDNIDDDVEDDDDPEPEEELTVSKRPPPLPHDATALPLAAIAGTPGARPIHTSQGSAAPAPAPVALPRSAVIAALVSLLALGVFIVYRHNARTATNEPRIERTVQTPPVRIEEPLSAVPALPPAPPPSAMPAPAETTNVPATVAPSSPAKETEIAPAPKPGSVEKASATRPRAAAEAPHRPPSHEVTNTGFKPGGI